MASRPYFLPSAPASSLARRLAALAAEQHGFALEIASSAARLRCLRSRVEGLGDAAGGPGLLFATQMHGTRSEALVGAARAGHSAVALQLLRARADPNHQALGEGECTPLVAASVGGYLGVAQLLLEAKADPNMPTKNGCTAIYSAARHGHAELVHLLAGAGACADAEWPVGTAGASSGVTPLLIACQERHTAAVAALLGARADPDLAASDGLTPLHIVCQDGHSDIVRLLLASKADPNKVEPANNLSPLYIAASAEENHMNIVTQLLAAGSDPNVAEGNFGISPLISAAQSGHSDVVRTLLRHGANPNQAETTRHGTPLLLAAMAGQADVVRELLEAGALPNIAERQEGITPLLVASKSSHIAVMRLLLHARADPCLAESAEGVNPVYIAALRGSLDAVQLLLVYGASLEPVAPDRLPREVARRQGHHVLVQFIDAVQGGSPLATAVACRLHEDFRMALSAGVVGVQDVADRTHVRALLAMAARRAAWGGAPPPCAATLRLARGCIRGFAPSRYWWYHKAVRDAVRTVLLVSIRHRTGGLAPVAGSWDLTPSEVPVLPAELWLLLLSFVQRHDWPTPPYDYSEPVVVAPPQQGEPAHGAAAAAGSGDGNEAVAEPADAMPRLVSWP